MSQDPERPKLVVADPRSAESIASLYERLTGKPADRAYIQARLDAARHERESNGSPST
jgi:hypothetical protein